VANSSTLTTDVLVMVAVFHTPAEPKLNAERREIGRLTVFLGA
jgi:hypothetical protein